MKNENILKTHFELFISRLLGVDEEQPSFSCNYEANWKFSTVTANLEQCINKYVQNEFCGLSKQRIAQICPKLSTSMCDFYDVKNN